MKKILILIISIFILSGCTVEYNATITKDNVLENIVLNGNKEDDFPVPAYITDQGPSLTDQKVEGIEYYEVNYGENLRNFKYKFPFERYKDSRGINYCYKNVSINEINENSYRLSTNNYNSCIDYYQEIENLTINLHFADDFKITNHNADEVKGNTYTWLINRQNYDNKTIEITYSLAETTKEEYENNKKINFLVIVSCFGILIIVLTVVIKFKNKKVEG